MTREERLREKMQKKFFECFTSWLDHKYFTVGLTPVSSHEEWIQTIANQFAEESFYKVVELYKIEETSKTV